MTTSVDKTSFDYLNFVTKDRTVDETKEIYTDWLTNYDKAMVNIGWHGPLRAAQYFTELGLKKDVRILDVGAGTGKLGEELIKRGYKNLDALEPSEMIQKAKKLGIYKTYYDCYVKLGQPLPIKKDTYDVVIMSGMICPGHMHIEDLLELTKVVKPGGLICWTSKIPGYYGEDVPKYSTENLERAMNKYILNGVWKYHQDPIIIEKYYDTIKGMFYAMEVL